eukprot:3283814-Alexandrium_andersonii.AAC.1
MSCWLAYCQQLRICCLWDPFHRQWNDAQDSIRYSGLWWCVLLSSFAMNIQYGPWKNTAFFLHQQEAAQEYLHLATPSEPLYDAFYRLVCSDLGLEPCGSVPHKLEVLCSLSQSQCWGKKGKNVALARWFAWFDAFPWHKRL